MGATDKPLGCVRCRISISSSSSYHGMAAVRSTVLGWCVVVVLFFSNSLQARIGQWLPPMCHGSVEVRFPMCVAGLVDALFERYHYHSPSTKSRISDAAVAVQRCDRFAMARERNRKAFGGGCCGRRKQRIPWSRRKDEDVLGRERYKYPGKKKKSGQGTNEAQRKQ